MKTFNKIYVEITNKCNLSCCFCPGTKRPGKFLNAAEFSHILKEIKPHTDYVYFHLMGEPLLHPHFFDFIDMTAAEGLKVCITTNGTLLKRNEAELLKRLTGLSPAAGLSPAPIHKISISIQAMEANSACVQAEANSARKNSIGSDAAATADQDTVAGSVATADQDTAAGSAATADQAAPIFNHYLEDCFKFGQKAEGKTIIAYRLWNQGGANKENDAIIKMMHQYFPQQWKEDHNSYAIGNRIYLELGDKFDWPSPDANYIYSQYPAQTSTDNSAQTPTNSSAQTQTDSSAQTQTGSSAQTQTDNNQTQEQYYCYALKDQIGILSDGTVVPCCLDAEGCLNLGNIFETPLSQILSSPRALAIKNGFKNRRAAEDLCKRCGYASRFTK